ncbi:MAG: hypothetical protein JNM20_08055 [Rhizobiales bacterium]|nr:hypothetical protein [Hyphomicrobiales bacterium]
MTSSAPDLDIVYICSHGRSGSTLVGSVLGLAEGYCYVGEVRDVWTDGLADNLPCGCGRPFRHCPFWTQVFAQAFGGFDTPAAKEAACLFTGMYRPAPSIELFRLVLFPGAKGRDIARYTSALARLYHAIAEVSGCGTIVDSSKALRYGVLVARIPGFRTRWVNVIRDPRGIVHSRTRRARFRDGSDKPPEEGESGYRVFRIIAKWVARNGLSRHIMRASGGVRVIYEDFVRDQKPLLAAVAGPEQAEKVAAMLASGIPETVVQHQVAGNWVRGLKISPKESWRTELPQRVSRLTALLSAPWRRSYRFETYPSPLVGEGGVSEANSG